MICAFKMIHFKNFQGRRIEIYKFDPTHFLLAPELVRQACLKKKIKIDIRIIN